MQSFLTTCLVCGLSPLELGVIITIATAVVSVHIIERFVKLKKSLLHVFCKENGVSEESEIGEMLQRHFVYQDIAAFAIGKYVRLLVETMVLSHGIGMAINYHIIFGNTLYYIIFTTDENMDFTRTEVMFTAPNQLILSLMVLLPLPGSIIFCLFREFCQFSILSAF